MGENFSLQLPQGNVADGLDTAHLLLTEDSAELPQALSAFWEEMAAIPQDIVVSLDCFGNLPHDTIERTLEANLIRIDRSAALRLILTDDYLRPELRQLLNSEVPYLLAKPVGREIWLGPLVHPGETATWECLAYWLRSRRWLAARLSGWGYPPQPSVAAHPTTFHFAIAWISLYLLNTTLANNKSPLENGLLTFDVVTHRSDRHTIKARYPLPRPQLLGWDDWVSPHTGIVAELSGPHETLFGLHHVRARYVLSPLPYDLPDGTPSSFSPSEALANVLSISYFPGTAAGPSFCAYTDPSLYGCAPTSVDYFNWKYSDAPMNYLQIYNVDIVYSLGLGSCSVLQISGRPASTGVPAKLPDVSTCEVQPTDPSYADVQATQQLLNLASQKLLSIAEPVLAPAITTGGIVPGTIQPGEWVSIYGTNLASETATWTGNFPTSLGGTSVTIDGKPAYCLNLDFVRY